MTLLLRIAILLVNAKRMAELRIAIFMEHAMRKMKLVRLNVCAKEALRMMA